MTTVYDVPPQEFLAEVSKELRSVSSVKPPVWAKFVKTGPHKKRTPDNPDWWFDRVASVLRTVYMKGPIGISHLRVKYGGRKKRGVRPEIFVKASGNILRKALQQLESAGLVEKVKTKKGRVISTAGMSFCDKIAARIAKATKAK